MAERGKRQDPKNPAAQRREKRRRRAVGEENASQEDKRFAVLGLLRAVVVAAGVVAAGEAHRSHYPQERQLNYEPERLPWVQHEVDLDQRHGWRRSYRMEKGNFHKLVELLRPLLEVHAFFGGEAHRSHYPQERQLNYEPERLPWVQHEVSSSFSALCWKSTPYSAVSVDV
ncbi:unnamed protein product [Ectocarpus sp. CCAP 1310/34]|nr:unnamed protein product [Ectocarpus sp. CCAP 1310/34]